MDACQVCPFSHCLYPCAALADAGDPLRIARRLAATLPLSREEVLGAVREEVRRLLASLPPGASEGATDEAWYWAAPVLLDQAMLGLSADEVVGLSYGEDWGEHDAETRFYEHVDRAADVNTENLGRRPDDLVDVLTDMALGGLGVTALRALSRVAGGSEGFRDPEMRNQASAIAWALRNHANQSEMMALIRGGSDESAYWKDVLAHCVDGGLTSVLDEYAHILNESLGVNQKDAATKSRAIAREMSAALGMRASVNKVTDMSVRGGELAARLVPDSAPLRGSFRTGRPGGPGDSSRRPSASGVQLALLAIRPVVDVGWTGRA